MTLTGYLHPGYARSLAEFGTPLALPRSGGWLLKRAIPGSSDYDAVGCYPYLACLDWAALATDLAELSEDLVSVTAVPDPFGDYTLEDLQQSFPDSVSHFKDHYVADLDQSPDAIMSPTHRRRAERALRELDVEIHEQPTAFLDRWMDLFDLVVRRFDITGMRAFSRASFAQQLALPGCRMSLARHQGEVISAHIQLVHGDTAYAHLAANSPAAYTLGADYALYHAEIEHYAGKVRNLDWGGEAGLARDGNLSMFKRGWSTDSRPVYICGRILDRQRYEQLSAAQDPGSQRQYFPAYRRGELD